MDRNDEAYAHWSEANRFALEGLKSLFLINSGGAIAYLGIISNHKAAPAPMILFIGGSICTATGFILGYYSKLYCGNARLLKGPEAISKCTMGQKLNLAAAISVIVSVGFTVWATVSIYYIKFSL